MSEKAEKEKEENSPLKNQSKKTKIIKKFPFRKTKDLETAKEQNDLKDWKPTKINYRASNKKAVIPEDTNIAQAFFKSLSKPVGNAQKTAKIFDDDDQAIPIRKPIINASKPTAQQIKWDIQDQTFIKKQFIPNKQIEQKLEEASQNEQEEEVVIRAKKSDSTMKIRHVDINKVINENWGRVQDQQHFKNELWEGSQQLLEGKGNLSKIAKAAIEKSEEIDAMINQRALERKQMRSRYGW